MRFLLFSLLFVLGWANGAYAYEQTVAKQAYIVDYKTGQTLLAKNSDDKMPTSSMSKVMTMYMVFDALKTGSLSLDSELKVSEKAWRKGGSKMFVEVGKKVKVEDLIRGVIIQSGNDATIVLAEGVSGDEDIFARQMTAKAKSLGMKSSNFTNASGWPDPDHYSTPKDLALLAQKIYDGFPQYYKYYSEKEFEYNDIKQPNRNPLLFQDLGADGLKTGHTEIGGYGLMGSAQKNDRRVFLVLNGMSSEKERASEAKRLMLWALHNFEHQTAFQKSEVVLQEAVQFSKEEQASLTVGEDVVIVVPKTLGDQKWSYEVTLDQPLVAPLKAGQEVGKVIIKVPEMDDVTRPIFVLNDIEQKGWFGRTLEKIQAGVREKLASVMSKNGS